ncbi:MAG: hypothetical protein SH817_19320 [Leptospira sp.]|nr:hypothetical protein [Leptospira sp.]
MRNLIYDIVDLLEIIFLEPFRYLDEMKEIPFAIKPISNWLFSIIAAMSVSCGMSLLSPPYTVATVGFLLFGFFANLVVMRYFPFIICLIMDFYAQSKGRTNKVSLALNFSRHMVLCFSLFGPISLILVSFGVYGRGYGILLLIVNFMLYTFFVGRGIKYIYDLKDRDAFRFAYYGLFLTAGFPMIFNLYTATSILQSFAGGDF